MHMHTHKFTHTLVAQFAGQPFQVINVWQSPVKEELIIFLILEDFSRWMELTNPVLAHSFTGFVCMAWRQLPVRPGAWWRPQSGSYSPWGNPIAAPLSRNELLIRFKVTLLLTYLPKGFHFHTWDSSAVRVKLGSTYCGSHKGTFSSSQAFAYLHALSSGTARPMKRSFTLHNSKCLLALSACQVLDFCRKTPQKGVTVTNLASIRTAFSQHLPWGPGADGHRRWGAAPKDTWLFDLSACKKK